MISRLAGVVSGTLTLLAVVAATTAKGYLSTIGEFCFVVAVSAVAMFVAHFWSHLLAIRLTKGVDRRAILHEAVSSSARLVPAVVLLVVAPLADLVVGSMEVAVTAAMVALTVALFAYTWVGTRAFMWSLGTAAVGLLMTVFKVVV